MAVLERQPIRHSDAFRNEYREGTSNQSVVDDVVSYLGEYRLQVPKHSYSLRFKDGRVRGPHGSESMYDLCQKAIDLRRKEKKSFIRETAERYGFESLDRQLQNAVPNSTIIWMSPPGPKEEGYGNYGFVFLGKVYQGYSTGKNLQMTAIRVENPTIEQFNKAFYMLTDEKTEAEHAEEFLDSPRVMNEDIKEGYVDAVLNRVFNYRLDREKQEKFQAIIDRALPLIYDFANNPLRTRDDLYALENYVLELKRDVGSFDKKTPARLGELTGGYRQEPPKAAGSCGSTKSSNNIINSISSTNSLFSENEWFTCPKCGFEADGPIGNECPGCGLTKEAYAEESGEPVCD